MILLDQETIDLLLKNGSNCDQDHKPVTRIYTLNKRFHWLLSELSPQDGDMAFGLCDLGLGFPELGYVSITEMFSACGRLGLLVETKFRDSVIYPLSVYAKAAREHEKITCDPNNLLNAYKALNGLTPQK